jgi:two-component system copper resistance phosphate regulon response regulator CusR
MRILLIEDEKRIAAFVAKGLEDSGYTVDLAATGQAGIAALSDCTHDLVILDLMLPDMDGLTILEKIRLRNPTQPVLVLSARGSLEDRVAGLDLGADDYLVKPFAFVELLARVRALLRRGQSLPERLQADDLVLDCLRRKVSRGGVNIELAPKEFSILEYLLRNKGRALSRTMIVEHVWEMDYTGLTNIVDVYIRHLRSKVDDNWPRKLIKTVRGVGYMVSASDDDAPAAAPPEAR